MRFKPESDSALPLPKIQPPIPQPTFGLKMPSLVSGHSILHAGLQLVLSFHVLVTTRSLRDFTEKNLESEGALHLGPDFGSENRENLKECTSEETVKAVLVEMGLDPDLHQKGIVWQGCQVVALDFAKRRDLNGSLSSNLGELQHLRRLKLGSTQLNGDISALQNAKNLQELDLDNTKVHGDISALRNAKELQSISLWMTKIAGDITALQNATELHYLGLGSTQVAGDIGALQNAKNLHKLYVADTKVSGDIRALHNAKDVTVLYFCRSQIIGDISDLRNAKKLERLSLANTQVAGDISALQDAKQLEYVYLKQSKVAGDIKALQNATKLRRLGLQYTQVSGSISALQSAKQLEHLRLQNTKVAGNISALQDSKQLKYVSLQNSEVTGDLSSLLNWPIVEEVGPFKYSGAGPPLERMARQGESAAHLEAFGRFGCSFNAVCIVNGITTFVLWLGARGCCCHLRCFIPPPWPQFSGSESTQACVNTTCYRHMCSFARVIQVPFL